MQCFPLLLIFPRFLLSATSRFHNSAFPHFRISSFPRFLVSSFPRFLVSCFGLRFVSRSVSSLGLRFVSRSISRSVSHIGFYSTILDSRPTPVPVPVSDSGSISPSLGQRLLLLLAWLLHGVALYRRQHLITDSHSARPRRVRS